MSIALMLFTTLFAVDNKVFFETVEQNINDGLSWHYVGKSDPDGQLSITMRNEQTGEHFIYFKIQKA